MPQEALLCFPTSRMMGLVFRAAYHRNNMPPSASVRHPQRGSPWEMLGPLEARTVLAPLHWLSPEPERASVTRVPSAPQSTLYPRRRYLERRRESDSPPMRASSWGRMLLLLLLSWHSANHAFTFVQPPVGSRGLAPVSKLTEAGPVHIHRVRTGVQAADSAGPVKPESRTRP